MPLLVAVPCRGGFRRKAQLHTIEMVPCVRLLPWAQGVSRTGKARNTTRRLVK
jgi:hypothetical protein